MQDISYMQVYLWLSLLKIYKNILKETYLFHILFCMNHKNCSIRDL